MAVKEKKVNKSHEIRVLVTKHPKASVKQIIAWLDKKDIKVPPQAVYAARAKLMHKPISKIEGSATTAMNGVALNGNGSSVRADDVIATLRDIKKIAAHVGGVETLKQILDCFS